MMISIYFQANFGANIGITHMPFLCVNRQLFYLKSCDVVLSSVINTHLAHIFLKFLIL